ncbi:MAG: MATE family efflux transporter, partial [Bacteroidaceae bacterium]|nr:MATE family efflux transporter [Bacteroidaceae bacterium]
MSHHKEILRLALPSVVTNITVPLLALADTAIVGHLGQAAFIGATAIGGTIFSMIYWIFAFLRMGTTGLVAQARGRQDRSEARTILVRALRLSVCISTLLLILQVPILRVALYFMAPAPEVSQLASLYFRIVVWGAPAVLAQYVLTGWYIGEQDTRSPMLVALAQNLLNVALSLTLVYVARMGFAGVAMGTVLSQWAGLLFAIGLLRPYIRGAKSSLPPVDTTETATWRQMLRVNSDIFLRTVCLVAVTVSFTAAGSRQGELTLSANMLLMQLFILYSYFTDGLANAAEALAGKWDGAGCRRELHQTVRCLFAQGAVVSAAFCLLYLLGGRTLLALLTNVETVRLTAATYLPWASLIPIVALPAMVWDGVF